MALGRADRRTRAEALAHGIGAAVESTVRVVEVHTLDRKGNVAGEGAEGAFVAYAADTLAVVDALPGGRSPRLLVTPLGTLAPLGDGWMLVEVDPASSGREVADVLSVPLRADASLRAFDEADD